MHHQREREREFIRYFIKSEMSCILYTQENWGSVTLWKSHYPISYGETSMHFYTQYIELCEIHQS